MRAAGGTTVSQELLLALLADARLPTGGHTQSAGLEPAMRAGLRADDVPAYVVARLRTVTATEAGAAVVARRAVVDAAGVPAAVAGLRAVRRAWAARTPSPALREAAERLGRGYVRLVERLWGDHPGVAALAAVARDGGARRGVARLLALGVAAACAGLDAVQLARLVGYDDVQTVVAASLKLAPLDPAVTTGWVLAAAPEVDRLAHEVAGLRAPDEIPSGSAPLVEAWAQAHATATERLFSA